MTVNANNVCLLFCQILSDVDDARKYFVPGISWHCFYFWVFMHKTIGSELPPSDENTVLVYEWFHLWERDENSPTKRREYKVYFKTL